MSRSATDPDSLVAFLRARLEDDVAVALETTASGSNHGSALYVLDDDFRYNTIVIDRSRVLAEVAAKRAILELHGVLSPSNRTGPACRVCVDWDEQPAYEPPPMELTPCPTLLALAAPYADHSDFQPSWRVDTPEETR